LFSEQKLLEGVETMRLVNLLLSSLLVVSFVAVGCAGEDAPPPLPEGFDDTALVESGDSKSDMLTRWYTGIVGPIAFGQSVSATTGYGEYFDGYTLTLTAGDKVELSAQAKSWGYLALYRKNTSGKWGGAKAKDYIWWDSKAGAFQGSLQHKAKKGGEYLVVVGSPWQDDLSYTLNLNCLSGTCEKAPHCVEYEAADSVGNGVGNFYALNVDSYEAGKQLLADLKYGFVGESITEGACSDIVGMCPLAWAPVCADVASAPAETFGNTCEYKKALRQAAGTKDAAKGHAELGECGYCVEYETTDAYGNPYSNFYAHNVNSYQDGKAILAALNGQFINEDINEGACSEQGTFCTFVYAPVCGDSPYGTNSSYGNVCSFKNAIRGWAGKSGQGKGHWELGACEDITCSYGGQDYVPGDSFPATDGCNTCTCGTNGLVGCTKIACPVDTCEYDGKVYPAGDSFPANDGCNTCSCQPGGLVACTKMFCGNTCNYNGQVYTAGATFPASDGCNTCTCDASGSVGCTEMACICNPTAEWYRDYIGTSSTVCAVIKFTCPVNTTYFSNDCGCGCEQAASCPEWLNCMPPTPTPCSDMQLQCPYSQVAY
jgi:hypothetical protein